MEAGRSRIFHTHVVEYRQREADVDRRRQAVRNEVLHKEMKARSHPKEGREQYHVDYAISFREGCVWEGGNQNGQLVIVAVIDFEAVEEVSKKRALKD